MLDWLNPTNPNETSHSTAIDMEKRGLCVSRNSSPAMPAANMDSADRMFSINTLRGQWCFTDRTTANKAERKVKTATAAWTRRKVLEKNASIMFCVV